MTRPRSARRFEDPALFRLSPQARGCKAKGKTLPPASADKGRDNAHPLPRQILPEWPVPPNCPTYRRPEPSKRRPRHSCPCCRDQAPRSPSRCRCRRPCRRNRHRRARATLPAIPRRKDAGTLLHEGPTSATSPGHGLAACASQPWPRPESRAKSHSLPQPDLGQIARQDAAAIQ